MAQLLASLPQPDFDRVSQGLHMASTELQKCPNIPALQQGNAILQAIQELTASFNRSQDETRRRFDQIDNRLGRIESRLDRVEARLDSVEARLNRVEVRLDTMDGRLLASDHNAVARLYNRMLHSPDDELRPLLDTQNRAVDQFPRTSRAIREMRAPILNTVLQALGAGLEGNVEQKRLTLRLLAGLPTDVP